MEVIRFDMSEYKEPHKIASLIGSPPGYVGYGEGKAGSGKLINELERVPNCVLLFDEIEKAHPDVIQVLLGLMDNGIITGSDNKQVSGRNAFVILTSNLGAVDSEKQVIGFGDGFNSSASDEAVKRFFSPEFRNRLDAVVKFNRLHKDVIRRIADKFINQIRQQLAEQNQSITVDDSALDYLAANGYSETMGARPMKRLINEEIRLPVAKRIIKDGLNVHRVSSDGNKLLIA
jgi:ATP-dependent Clp protease ATP-binding subunit ClpA